MPSHPLDYDLFLFDADGTLRVCTVPGQPCPNQPDEWELMPNVKKTLAAYDWNTKCACIVSNQGGVGLGYLSEGMAHTMLAQTLIAALERWPTPRHIFMCTHMPEDKCLCRKPLPGLIEKAVTRYACRVWPGEAVEDVRQRTLYVGDMESDRECAAAAGVDFMWAQDFFGWKESA
jgi:D-glycero-D-manno-heptose 1,7-bisphosphate phosphatase